MSVVVVISGLEKFQRMLDPSTFQAAVSSGIDRSAQALADTAKRMPAVSAKTTGYGVKGIPVDTGRMRQSIQKRKLQLLAAEVVAPINYSGHVHEGTANMDPRPFFLWAYEDFGGMQEVERIMATELEKAMKVA